MENLKKRFFLAYDFSSDKRRAQFVKILEKYGVRVQYSIFEFSLTPAREIEFFSRMKQKGFLKEVIGESILIIPITKDTSKKIQRYGETIDLFDRSGIFSI
jgi:CRISPR-associated protein Cas2